MSQSLPSVSLPSTLETKRDLKKVVAPEDPPYICPIGYVYDPIPEAPANIDTTVLAFPRYASKNCDIICRNAIRINPRAAGLPYRSKFDYIGGNRHWEANFEEHAKILELIIADHSTTHMEMRNGFTLSEIAIRENRPGLEHRLVVATSYMFPTANERRVRTE